MIGWGRLRLLGGGILDFYLTGCLLPDGIGSFVCDLLRIVIGLELLLLTFICASQMSRPNFIVYIGIQRPIIIRISCAFFQTFLFWLYLPNWCILRIFRYIWTLVPAIRYIFCLGSANLGSRKKGFPKFNCQALCSKDVLKNHFIKHILDLSLI